LGGWALRHDQVAVFQAGPHAAIFGGE